MQPLPTTPTAPEPPAEAHPNKGRCVVCGQRLHRLWIWSFGAWSADRWCDACYDTTRQGQIASRMEAVRARRLLPKEAA